ncbi:MAG: glycoside hydrolase family 99-like domain-containing protein [Planctomycetes bacterium]|nr:glycoside hydrolase family 99-like domain-containing protein [Planctomycetota bacterium]
MRVAAYVYPGWHPIPERDESFHPGFTEWELVAACRPRFEGHAQPRVPLLGEYDDRDPIEVERRVALAREHGIDALVYGSFWCRGKRVFEDALDRGFLGSGVGQETPFAVMWANRMPRRVLPVRRADLPVIDGRRRVPTDVEDFVAFVGTMAREYFVRPNYLTVGGYAYLSVFDSTFFLLELGIDGAREAIARAREWLAANDFPELHLAAIDPSADVIGSLREVGFDSVTQYVLLPEWKGDPSQDYATAAARRADEWAGYAERSGLPYMPSVAPGWDASPRGADFGPARPDKYPWSPVVTGEHPDEFRRALERALAFDSGVDDGLTFVASLNEWSEGHYLEPDTRFGNGWLEAVRAARRLIHPD